MKTIKLTSPAGHNYEFPIADDTTVTIDGEVIIFEKKKWKPKEGDDFYYISFLLATESNRWCDSNTDNRLYNAGNCFQTETECLAKIEQIKDILK